jgi:hypothetical protein
MKWHGDAETMTCDREFGGGVRHSRCRGKQSDPVEVQSDLGSAVVDEAPRANPGMAEREKR